MALDPGRKPEQLRTEPVHQECEAVRRTLDGRLASVWPSVTSTIQAASAR